MQNQVPPQTRTQNPPQPQNQPMNQPLNQNPPLNLNQGSIVATIQAEPRMKDVDVGIVTHAGATTGDDGPQLQVWLAGKKKVTFDIVTEKDTFFDTKNKIGRNPTKLPIVDMLFGFDPSVEARPFR